MDSNKSSRASQARITYLALAIAALLGAALHVESGDAGRVILLMVLAAGFVALAVRAGQVARREDDRGE
jgi:hypothetical protein